MRHSIVLLLVGAVLLTQRWYGWDEGIGLGGDDALSYEAIALAAPAFPATLLPFHHAQRLAGPYLAGLGAKASGLHARSVLLAATGACLLISILLLSATLSRLGVANWEFAFCMSLFVLHFTLRFYLVMPGMLPDALFVCGLALALYGLAGSNFGILLAGALIAAAGRQTALLVIPGVALWMAWGEGWIRRSAARKAAGIVIVSIAVGAVYLASSRLASPFSEPSMNLAHLTALVEWLLSPSFSVGELGIFLAYAIVPLLLALAMVGAALGSAGGRRPSPEILACLLLAVGIVSQPVLGGPELTNANAVRLCALSLGPLAVAAALLLRQAGYPQGYWTYRGPLIIGALVAASLHYNYTRIGPGTQIQFGALHLAIALFIGYLVYRRPVRKIESAQRGLSAPRTG